MSEKQRLSNHCLSSQSKSSAIDTNNIGNESDSAVPKKKIRNKFDENDIASNNVIVNYKLINVLVFLVSNYF